MAIPLGPFDLDRLVGVGGMGEVWAGVHRVANLPVAVKVMRPSLRGQSRLITAFRNEVRQVAKLEHPGIVMVLDQGVVSAETELASEGAIVAGCPFLAMEFASAGALDQGLGVVSWSALRTVLLSMLEALAHAHARGVLHRDIKPANVLLASVEDVRPGIKLTDFGIAQAVRDPSQEDDMEGFGTPEYMAPEQVLGRWREQGPWTDLYAVGAVAWQLSTGRVVFLHNNPLEIARAHVQDPLPEFEPIISVPPEFESWIRRLLEKNLRRRYRFAADAAWALREMKRVTDSGRVPIIQEQIWSQNTWVLDPEDREDADLLATGFADGEPPPSSAPPTPDTWRRPKDDLTVTHLQGAGLGLFGLRQVTLVGRTRPRDRIWKSLCNTRRTGRPRAVILRGPAGIGKSRLAWWIAERAHELGSAQVLWATHSPLPGPGEGISRMLARHLRCVGLSTDGLRRRLAKLGQEPGMGDEGDCQALEEWLLNSPGVPVGSGPFAVVHLQPRERYALLQRFLERLGRDRPVILVLDDVQWGAETLGFVTHLLSHSRSRRLPILVLMAARDEALASRLVESRLLEQLQERPDVSTIALGPLGPRERHKLVQRLLALDRDLAKDLAERTAGNPLFAVELVDDWVRRGVLELGPRGFRLRKGEMATLPDDIHVVWKSWVAQVLAYQPQGARAALELAAALGLNVDLEEWEAACRAFGEPAPPYLLDALQSARLALPREAGWAFVHEMLRESIEREAKEGGRWPELSLACAGMLQARQGARGNVARLGHHLLQAGRRADALEPLLAGIRESINAGDYPAAMSQLKVRRRAIDALRLAPDDRRRGQDLVERVRVHIGRAELVAGEELAVQGVALARQHGWALIQCRCRRYLAMLSEKRGDLRRAEGEFRAALALAHRHGFQEEQAACLEHRGSIRRTSGDRVGSLRYLERAKALYQQLGDDHGLANCLKELGGTLVTFQEPAKAAIVLEQAADLYRKNGNRSGRGECLNNLGDVHRRLGNLTAAEATYREAFELLERAESAARMYPRCNLGLVLALQQRPLEARGVLRAALKEALAQERGVVQTWLHAVLTWPMAELRAWKAFDRHLRQARAGIARTGLVDPDVAEVLTAAAIACEQAGQSDRALRTDALAQAQSRALEQD
jgi:serine/threonine protein kinase/tetratricopeptide (TPR) repeat protein